MKKKSWSIHIITPRLGTGPRHRQRWASFELQGKKKTQMKIELSENK